MLAISFSEAGAARFSVPSCRPFSKYYENLMHIAYDGLLRSITLSAWEMLSEYLETSSSLAELSPLRVMAAASAIFLNPAIIWSGSCGSGGISPLGVSGPPNNVFIRSAKIFACSLKIPKFNFCCNVRHHARLLYTYTKNASGSSTASPPASLTLLASADVFCLAPPVWFLSKSCSASTKGVMLVLLYKAQME